MQYKSLPATLELTCPPPLVLLNAWIDYRPRRRHRNQIYRGLYLGRLRFRPVLRNSCKIARNSGLTKFARRKDFERRSATTDNTSKASQFGQNYLNFKLAFGALAHVRPYPPRPFSRCSTPPQLNSSSKTSNASNAWSIESALVLPDAKSADAFRRF